MLTAEALKTREHGRRVKVAGVVTHRQRPSTAEGVTFLNLEDETGPRERDLLGRACGAATDASRAAAKAMIITGRLERVEGVINLIAHRLEDARPEPGDGVARLPLARSQRRRR